MPLKHFDANVPMYVRNLMEEKDIVGKTNFFEEGFEKVQICVVFCIELRMYGASCTIYKSE